MYCGAPTPAGQRHRNGRIQMEVALDGWGGEWVECESVELARKGSAMEKCRLFLLSFVPVKNNFLLSHEGWAFSPRLCYCLIPATPGLYRGSACSQVPSWSRQSCSLILVWQAACPHAQLLVLAHTSNSSQLLFQALTPDVKPSQYPKASSFHPHRWPAVVPHFPGKRELIKDSV